MYVNTNEQPYQAVPLPGSWTDGEGNSYALSQMAPEELLPLGWLPHVLDKPEVDHHQKYMGPQWEISPTEATERYLVVAMSADEITAVDAAQWLEVRNERHSFLSTCDWIVVRALELKDPVPQDWATYRQALRDITNQPDPWNITWPTVPPLPTTE